MQPNNQEQVSSYLPALCRMLRERDPDKFNRYYDEFRDVIKNPLYNHIRNEARSYPQLDIDLLYDITVVDKFLRRLRDQRPEKAKLIWELTPNLFPPPKRGDKYADDTRQWAEEVHGWTTKEMTFCEAESVCETELKKLNKEMEPLRLRGDDLLDWIGWEDQRNTMNSDAQGCLDSEEDGDESAIGLNPSSAELRRRGIARRVKVVAKLLSYQGISAADAEIGMEQGARFAVDTDEIIRAMPIIEFPREPFLRKIGANTVKDAIKEFKRQINAINKYKYELKSQSTISQEEDESEQANNISWGEDEPEEENGENSKLSVDERYFGDHLFSEESDSKSASFYSKVEFEQLLKRWRVFVNQTSALEVGEISKEADIQAGEELLYRAYERLRGKTPSEDEASSDRIAHIRACIAAPLNEASALFDKLNQEYQASDGLPAREQAKLKKGLVEAGNEFTKQLERHELNSRVMDTMLEGFKQKAERQEASNKDPSQDKGYSEEQIAKELGLKNRDAVRAIKEDIAQLLAPRFPSELRRKLIRSQWDYITRIRAQIGDAMPRLPRTLDADEWEKVLRWLVLMINQEISDTGFALQQAREKLRFLDESLFELCRFSQADLALGELQKLLNQPTEIIAAEISQRYRVALDAVESLLAQRREALDAIASADSDIKKAKKRRKQLLDGLDHF